MCSLFRFRLGVVFGIVTLVVLVGTFTCLVWWSLALEVVTGPDSIVCFGAEVQRLPILFLKIIYSTNNLKSI